MPGGRANDAGENPVLTVVPPCVTAVQKPLSVLPVMSFVVTNRLFPDGVHDGEEGCETIRLIEAE